MSVFVIAEAGVNHNGDEKLAMELIKHAKCCGADAVKFQTFSAESLVCPGAKKAEYQEKSSDGDDQFSMLKKLEMSDELHSKLFNYCKDVGVEFMSTPFDKEALDFLIGLGMKRIKIPSGEITNLPFIRYISSKDLPMIMSTGMSTLAEIQVAVDVIVQERIRCGFTDAIDDVLTILHCTSNYPAKCEDVNLNAMITIKDTTNLPVGYSDHTLGTEVAIASVAMGARVVEKHFTLDKKMSGPDHQASLSVEELMAMITSIRNVENALGSFEKVPSATELPVRDVARRSICLIADVEEGAKIDESDLRCLRPGTGIPPSELTQVIGMSASRDLKANTCLQWTDVK